MSDWLADTFQLRLGWSRTVIRPDLREITDASYIDPITEMIRRLRKVLEQFSYDRLIQTVRGTGYRFSTRID